MATPYSGDDENYAGSATLPDDGDNADAASVNVPLEACIDGLAYIYTRVLTWEIGTVPGGYAQKSPMVPRALNEWSEETDAGTLAPLGWYQTDNSGNELISFEINPPHCLARLQRVYVRLDGNGHTGAGAHANMPANKPQITVYRVSGGSLSTLHTETDPTTDKAIYDTPHSIVCPAAADPALDLAPLSFGQRLFVQVAGESGADSAANSLLVLDVACTWTSEDLP